MTAITLNLDPIIHLDDDQFYQLCQANRDVKFERNTKGELIVMPPTGGETGNRNIELAFQLQAWSRQNKLGIAFDSSTGFKLPNGAYRSPDAAWVRLDRWEALTPEQRRRFPPLAPDFVIELRSLTDDLKPLQEKMQEYRDNGVRLGWLIDPLGKSLVKLGSQHLRVCRCITGWLGKTVCPTLPNFICPPKSTS